MTVVEKQYGKTKQFALRLQALISGRDHGKNAWQVYRTAVPLVRSEEEVHLHASWGDHAKMTPMQRPNDYILQPHAFWEQWIKRAKQLKPKAEIAPGFSGRMASTDGNIHI